jgi:hypothetical protein
MECRQLSFGRETASGIPGPVAYSRRTLGTGHHKRNIPGLPAERIAQISYLVTGGQSLEASVGSRHILEKEGVQGNSDERSELSSYAAGVGGSWAP